MQAIESETLILYHTDLRGEWPEAAASGFAARLPYARRVVAGADRETRRASLAGVALALQALAQLMGRAVPAGELVFERGEKPRLAPGPDGPGPDGASPDFSISHSGPWVGCAVVGRGQVGFDVELGTDERRAQWVVREALIKATGEGLHALEDTRALAPTPTGVCWRGVWWHLARLAIFSDATACVASSRPLRTVEARFSALGELFAP
jgi:hypothetical protein